MENPTDDSTDLSVGDSVTVTVTENSVILEQQIVVTNPAALQHKRLIATAELEQLLCNPNALATVAGLVLPAADSWTIGFHDLTSLPKPNTDDAVKPMSVCIATEDIVGPVRNGGIGTTYAALAEGLAAQGHNTTILYLRGQDIETGTLEQWVDHYAARGVKFVPVPNYAQRDGIQTGSDRWMRAPYNMLRYLIDNPIDIVHVSEWRGSSYLCLLAKRQGLAFKDTLFVVKTSSPWMWNRLYGSHPLDRVEDLAKINAEIRSVEMADMVIGGSLHLLQWMLSQGYRVPRSRTFVQPNYVRFDHLKTLIGKRNIPYATRIPITEIVFFGRLEARKGLLTFCQAINRLLREDVRLPETISFMGKPGAKLPGRPNQTILEFIEDETKDWPVKVQILTEFQQQQAIEYLLGDSRLAVMPSTIENSSMAVYEAAICKIPFVASSVGGTPELVHRDDRAAVLCDPHPIPLAEKIQEAIDLGGFIARASFDNDYNVDSWHNFHRDLSRGLRHQLGESQLTANAKPVLPSVCACIYYVGDQDALRETLASLKAQDALPDEVLIAVDAPKMSAMDEAREVANSSGLSCAVISTFDEDVGLSFNTLTQEAKQDFLLFLWAGTKLHPHALKFLCNISVRSSADLLNFFYRHVDATRPEGPHPLKAHILGSLSEDFFRTDLTPQPLFVNREAYLRVGGFTSDYRVLGYDSEFLSKAQLSGLHCETALIELASVPMLSQQWLNKMCYDQAVSHFRAIRPQLANAPLAIRDLLLMAKGLNSRPPGKGKKAPAAEAPKAVTSNTAFSRMLRSIGAIEEPVPVAPPAPAIKAAPVNRPIATAVQKARPNRSNSNLIDLFEEALDISTAKENSNKPTPPRAAYRKTAKSSGPKKVETFSGPSSRLLYVRDGAICGWATNYDEPDKILKIEAVNNGKLIAEAIADRKLDLPRHMGFPEIQSRGFLVEPFARRTREPQIIDLRIAGTDQYVARNLEIYAPAASIDSSPYQGYCDPTNDGILHGWVWNRERPDERLDVAVFIDDQFAARLHADIFREDLASSSIGTGEHSFRLSLRSEPRERTIDVVIAQNGLRLRYSPLLLKAKTFTAIESPIAKLGRNISAFFNKA